MRPDPLGALLALVGAAGALALPFVTYKATRIASGGGRTLFESLPFAPALGLAALLAGCGVAALAARGPRARLAAACLGAVALLLALDAAAAHLTPANNRYARVAPGGGAWLLLLALALLATDALARLRPGPWARVGALLAATAALGAILGSGALGHLSVMREYAVNAETFGREAARHVALAFGSLAAAVLAGLPLGILCHRRPALRAATLQTLNLVQTIPSIALFGILMVPLGALAAAWPWLGELGIRGIGAAPAALALFLYSLLPVVANAVVGLGQVSPAAVDAARGMGMAPWRVLADVELPLALPVILTGVRIVLVQNIGLVTIAALIGGGGFGTFVFQGIGQTAIDLVLLGAAPTVALAFAAAVLLDAAVELSRRAPT